LHLAEQGRGGKVLRFWESPELFIVLGKIGKEQDDVKIDAVLKDGISVLRRSSGGGTVLQGKGCLNYSLVLSKACNPQIADLRKSYRYILGKIILALKQLGVEAVFCPISDIALADSLKKISGNAQKRSKQFILHHGTILYDFDLPNIEKYLKIPKETPEYRQRRSHLDFVANVPFNVGKMKNSLKKVFKVTTEENYLNAAEQECLQSFLASKTVRVNLTGER
jgi:lipoate-protein ligase A